MEVSDILKVEITDLMIAEANEEAEWLRVNKFGNKTRNLAEDRDLIGSLAHQCVEIKLTEMGRPFESTRKIKEKKGDKFDVKVNGDFVDVKGSHGTLDNWFFNRKFMCTNENLASMEGKEITHFCFVVIDLAEKMGYIFGVIETETFLEKARPITVKCPSHFVFSRELTPFISYINHTL